MKRILRLGVFSLLLCLTQSAWAQERVVTGKVTSSEDGGTLPGVNVILKGTTTGTTTSADGTYRLNVPEDGATLIFSFIGFRTVEVTVGSRDQVDVALETDILQLNEVVVTGYGVQERRKLSTSIASVSGSDIAQLATPSFVDQLAGRAAGVQVTVPSGIIGQTPQILIRGVNSLSSGTFPLVVIDGIPMTTGSQSAVTPTNPLGDINPADIESYEILKDGAAAAIYGSRAANGVILVTTKRGSKTRGKANVELSVAAGWSEAVNRFDLLNAAEFEQVANRKLANAGLPAAAFTNPNVPGSGETDWQDVLLRKGAFTNYNVNVSGATENTNYYFSVGYQQQESNIVRNDFERLSFRTNLDHRINKWFKVGTGLNLTNSVTNGLNTGSNALSGNLAGGIRAFPNVTVFNPNHPTGYNITNDFQALGQGANTLGITSNWTNQAYVLDKNIYRADATRLLANIYGQIDIIEGLSLKTYYGVDWLGNKDFQTLDNLHGDGRGSSGLLFNQFREVTLWNWQNTLSFNRDFGGHGIDVVAGAEYQLQTFDQFFGQGQNFSDPFFLQNGLISGTFTIPNSGGSYNQTSFESYFGRINYSFKDRYLFGFSVRRDGLSRLAEDSRFGTFFGGSVGYRLSEEDFFKNSSVSKVISDLKIRGSYAEVGNADIGLFPYAGIFGSARYGSQNGIAFSQAGNANLQWETAQKLNIGADFRFSNNRFGLTFDYFVNDVDGNILAVPYPPSLGIPGNAINQNIGVIRNKGFEFVADATVMNKGGFTWNINANFTSVQNEVIETFRNSAGNFAEVGRGSYLINARVGEQINVIYGFEWAGVNSANGFPIYAKGNGTFVQRNVSTGAYSVYDPANPTNTATAATLSQLDVSEGGDRRILGNTLPTWYGGLTNTLNYKGISLELFFRFSGGNEVYNQTRQDVLLNQDFTNSGTELLNSWTPENTVTDIPRMVINNNVFVNQSGEATSRFVESGDFLRLQNIVLGYNLPVSILNKISDSKISRVRIFGQVQNAFTWAAYSGLDPELGAGIDNNTNPLNRTYTFGLNIGF